MHILLCLPSPDSSKQTLDEVETKWPFDGKLCQEYSLE